MSLGMQMVTFRRHSWSFSSRATLTSTPISTLWIPFGFLASWSNFSQHWAMNPGSHIYKAGIEPYPGPSFLILKGWVRVLLNWPSWLISKVWPKQTSWYCLELFKGRDHGIYNLGYYGRQATRTIRLRLTPLGHRLSSKTIRTT